MVSPMKISARVEIDASGAKKGAAESSAAVASIGTTAEQTAAKLGELNKAASEGVRSSLAVVGGAGASKAQDAAAAALDRLRAKFDPVIAAQQRYKSRVEEIAQAQAAGAVTASQAIDLRLREKASFDALISSIHNVAAARKSATENAVSRVTVTPDRGADIAAYGVEMDRLQARYDPLFAAQQRHRKAVSDITTAERAGAISGSQAIDLRLREKAALDSLVSSLNNVAAARKAAAEAAVSRVTITPDRGADIAAYGKELDKLRQRFNPLYSAISQYKVAQAEIRQAHAVGALSADEMSAALSRNRQATLASIDAIKGRNKAINDTPGGQGGNQKFQTANLAFQAQDIITTAPFMPWYTVALQQGPQVAAVMDSLDDKAAGLKGAFMSLISPWSLLSVAAVGATAFAIQYFTKAADGAKTADTLLKEHSDTVASLKDRYGEAAAGLRAYVNEGVAGTSVDLRDRLKDAYEQIADATRNRSTYSVFIDPLATSTETKIVQDYRQAFIDLRKSIADGEPDLLRFRDAMARIADNNSAPEAVRKLAREMREFDPEIVNVARAIPSMVQQIELIGGSANAQVGGVSALSKALQDLSQIAMPALSDSERAFAAYEKALSIDPKSRSAQIAYDAALERIRNQNPTVNNSDGNQTTVPIPVSKPITLGDKPDKAATSAANSARNAYRDLIKSADDRIGQMKLEAELAGQTGIAADTLRFKLNLLQQSEDKGRSLTPAQTAAIKARVESFKQYAEQVAKARLAADLLFEREQLGRSAMDQQIAGGLRGAGLPVDFDSYEAGLIRTNLQLQYARDLAGDFTNTFFGALDQGKSVWEAFGDAGVAALKRIADTLMNDVLNSLFGVQSAAGSGGSGGGLISALIGKLGGGRGAAANDNSNVVKLPVANAATSASALTGYLASGKNSSHVTGMSGDLQSSMAAMLRDAPREIASKITINSGFRSVARQSELFDAAVTKYGSVAAARKWVAPPGNSQHNFGNAADLGFGSSAAQSWTHQNAASYGLKFPMKHEPWHIETSSARSGGASAALEKLAGSAGKTTANLGNLGGGIENASQGLGNLGSGLNQFGKNLSSAFPSAPSKSGGLGGLFSSLFGGGLSSYGKAAAAASPQFSAAWSAGGIGLFSDGGYTGSGGIHEPKGVVHAGEVVWSQRDVARAGGVQTVEAMRLGRRGYAEGGIVSVTPMPALNPSNNNTSSAQSGSGSRPGNINIKLEGARGDREIEDASKRGMMEALREYDAGMPDRVAGINQNPRWRS